MGYVITSDIDCCYIRPPFFFFAFRRKRSLFCILLMRGASHLGISSPGARRRRRVTWGRHEKKELGSRLSPLLVSFLFYAQRRSQCKGKLLRFWKRGERERERPISGSKHEKLNPPRSLFLVYSGRRRGSSSRVSSFTSIHPIRPVSQRTCAPPMTSSISKLDI